MTWLTVSWSKSSRSLIANSFGSREFFKIGTYSKGSLREEYGNVQDDSDQAGCSPVRFEESSGRGEVEGPRGGSRFGNGQQQARVEVHSRPREGDAEKAGRG